MSKKELGIHRLYSSISNYHLQKPKSIHKVNTQLKAKPSIGRVGSNCSSPNYNYNNNNQYLQSTNSNDYINTLEAIEANKVKEHKTKLNLQHNSRSKSKPKPKQGLLMIKDKSDKRLEYTLNALNMVEYLNIFQDNQIMFEDLFLLAKDDFIEMNIPIGPRNRLLSFQKEYREYGGSCLIQHIKDYFNSTLRLNHIASSTISQTEGGSDEVKAHKHNSTCINPNKYIALETKKWNEDKHISNDTASRYNTIQSEKSIKDQGHNKKQCSCSRGNSTQHNSNGKCIDVLSNSKHKNEYKKAKDKAKANTIKEYYNQLEKFNSLMKESKSINKEKNIKQLFKVKHYLKSQLEECNKSINEKQLLIKLLEESSKLN